MDAATRFTLGTEDFAKMLGPKTAAVLDRPWADIAETLKLDPQGQVAKRACRARHLERHRRALAGRRYGCSPCRSRCRACRCSTATASLPVIAASASAATSIAWPRWSSAERKRRPRRPTSSRKRRRINILPFAPPPAEEPPALSPGERSAFEELARELSARLKKTAGKSAAAPAPDDFGREPAALRRRSAHRRGPRATAMPPAISMRGGRFSTACRSASWSIASTR